MRKLITLAAAALTTMAITAVPASASDTAVTFSVTGGGLSIATDTTAKNLGSVTSSSTGTKISGALAEVKVTDSRASTAGWKTQVASTDWVDPGADLTTTTDDLVITVDKGKMWVSGGPTVVSGTAVVTAPLTEVDAIVMAKTAKDFATATTTGSNEVTYTPSVVVAVGSEVLTGTYTATITQTVV